MLRFLNVCAEVEESVCNVYTLMSEQALTDAALKLFWSKMAADEASHATQIRFAMRLPAVHTFKEATLPMDRVSQLLADVRALEIKLQHSVIPETQALQLALTLEEDFLSVHIDSAVVFKDETMRKMLNSLGCADKDHVEKLRRFCKERGI